MIRGNERKVGGRPSLVEISRSLKAADPVFIVGEARSGSTILYRTLLKHPAFKPRVENLQESSFILQAPLAASFSPDQPRNMRRFMLEDEIEWANFLHSIRRVRWWARLTERPPLQGLGPRRLVARSYAHHARQARGCHRLLEKTPNHIHHVDEIRRIFPGSSLIYIHRHPVDVYSSLVRRGVVDPKADWARITVDEFCNRYRSHLRRAREGVARHPDSMTLVRYEDFTTSPEAALQELCDFLQIPYTPETLTELDDPAGWSHWDRSRHLYEGIKTHTKRWQDYCDSETAAHIQGRLGPEMEAMGHRPYDLPGSTTPLTAADV